MGGSHHASEPKPAGSPASQAFCNAKPWRRRNLLPPSKSNHRRVSAQRARTHKAAFWRPCQVARQCGAQRRIVIGGISFRREMIKSERRCALHTEVQTRRKSGVSSVLRSKTLAQAEFTSAEQVQSPKGERPKGANPAKRLLAAVPSGTSIRSAAQNCHRRNSFPPSNDKIGTEVCVAHRKLASPGVRRLKRFAQQNLGAGGIYFRRAC